MRTVVLALVALALAIAVLALALVAEAASAQTFPSRPIRMIVPQPPGGSMDANMRALAEPLERELGAKIVIDNRGGANGIIAGELLAKAPADGYTLLYTSNSFANNQLLYTKLPFNVLNDFEPVTLVATMPGYFVLVHPAVPAQTLAELVALSRSTTVHFGSGGIGNSQHLLGELINARTGAKLVHVPYKGLAPMSTALLANEIQIAFASPTTVVPHLKSKRLRAIAYTGAKRWSGMPEVPTVAEAANIPGFTYEAAWHGLFAPAGTPAPVLAKIQSDFAKALTNPKAREFFESGGYQPVVDSPAEFAKYLREYLRQMEEVLRIANVKPE